MLTQISSFSDASAALTLFAIVVSSLYIFYRVYRRHLETKKPFQELPMAEGNNWIFGHARDLIASSNFDEAYRRVFVDSANKYGQTGYWAAYFRGVSVLSVQDARTVLNTQNERRPPLLARHFNRNFIGDKNLLIINGREWKFHRNAVARTFNPKFLLGSRAGMKSVAETMVHSIQEKIHQSGENVKEMDMEPLLKMITLDVFGKIALSTDFQLCTTLKPSPLVRAFEFLLNGTIARLSAPWRPKNFFYSLPFEQNRIHNKERQLIRSFVADLINEKRDSMEKEDDDLLSHLIRAHHEVPGGKLKPEDVSDEAMTDVLMTLLFAGYGKCQGGLCRGCHSRIQCTHFYSLSLVTKDTTSVTLTFALYLLANHPEIQELCFEEIRDVKTIENMEELVYCKAVIWEALRLFPAAVRTNRALSKPVELSGGFVAPAGTRVIIPIWNIHRDEQNFPEPETFRPDRWAKQDESKKCWVERDASTDSDEGDIAAGDHKAFLAFSAGGR